MQKSNDKIVRYTLPSGPIAVRKGPSETIVSGLLLGGDHPMHPFASSIWTDGMWASTLSPLPRNGFALQPWQNRFPLSPVGTVPCTGC